MMTTTKTRTTAATAAKAQSAADKKTPVRKVRGFFFDAVLALLAGLAGGRHAAQRWPLQMLLRP
jgi:hypothetical protein